MNALMKLIAAQRRDRARPQDLAIAADHRHAKYAAKARKRAYVSIVDDARVIDGKVVIDIGLKVESPHSAPHRRDHEWKARVTAKIRQDTRDRSRLVLQHRLKYTVSQTSGYAVELYGRVSHVGILRFSPQAMASDNLLEALHYYRDGAFDVLAGYEWRTKKKRIKIAGVVVSTVNEPVQYWLGSVLDDDQRRNAIPISYNQMKACGCEHLVRCKHESAASYGLQIIYTLRGES